MPTMTHDLPYKGSTCHLCISGRVSGINKETTSSFYRMSAIEKQNNKEKMKRKNKK